MDERILSSFNQIDNEVNRYYREEGALPEETQEGAAPTEAAAESDASEADDEAQQRHSGDEGNANGVEWGHCLYSSSAFSALGVKFHSP